MVKLPTARPPSTFATVTVPPWPGAAVSTMARPVPFLDGVSAWA
jgi:hypothetical protein